jgi:hypothetical protein
VGLADFDEATRKQPVIVRFELPNTFGRFFYVAFNHADGIHEGTNEGRNQVLVTSKNSDYIQSELLALLDEGDEFEIAEDDFTGGSGESVRIRVEKIRLDEEPAVARVSIEVVDDGCFPIETFTDARGCDWYVYTGSGGENVLFAIPLIFLTILKF